MRYDLIAAVLLAGAAQASLAEDAHWSGAYVGLSTANSNGSHEYSDGDGYDLGGKTTGAFGGYLWEKKNVVYGVDANFSNGAVYESERDGSSSYEGYYQYDHFAELTGRLGYAVGKVLVYSTLGLSQTQFHAAIGDPDAVDTKMSGLAYGLGADYKVAQKFFVGAQYLHRSYDFYDLKQNVDISAKLNTVTLRIGMAF